MSLVDRFLALKGRTFTSEDGDEYELALSPPMSDSELAAFERSIPCPLPTEIRDLLKVTRGFENGMLDWFDFTGSPGGFGLEEVFPSAISIAGDGFGNFWVVDLLPTSTTWGPIYFACHDAPVIVYQAADLSEFLDGLIEMMQPPFKGPVDFAHIDAMHNIWANQPNTIARAAALAGSEPELRAFAETVGEDWLIVDMRHPKLGDGFAWGRAQLPDGIKRWKSLPIWAYKPKKSLFKRLFGK